MTWRAKFVRPYLKSGLLTQAADPDRPDDGANASVGRFFFCSRAWRILLTTSASAL